MLEGHPGRGRGRALSPLKGSPGSSSQTIRPHLKGKYISAFNSPVERRKININMNKNETFPFSQVLLIQKGKRLDEA